MDDGKETPNINIYSQILINDIEDCQDALTYDAYRGDWFHLEVSIVKYVLDYPGINKLFHLSGSGAYSGCAWCDIRGLYLKNSRKMVYIGYRNYLPADHPLRNDAVFRYKCEECPKCYSTMDYKKFEDEYNEGNDKERVISFHLLVHIVEDLHNGPIHTKWMYAFERYNSYITRRVMSRSNPEACVMRTHRVYDWIFYFKNIGQLQTIYEEDEDMTGKD
ncbi:uncharacterized protein [Clytia hemisphaerica]|uniref:uncharacterized protein n=1 Tax=Clytia hemisphaerica TaxID=252671 RepID=UPI0034D581A6